MDLVNLKPFIAKTIVLHSLSADDVSFGKLFVAVYGVPAGTGKTNFYIIMNP